MIKPPSGLPISFLRGPAILFLLLVALQASAAVRYVSVANPNPSPPFTNWPRAARAIQDAIDIAQPGDEIVVTNGVYRTGGRVVYGTLTNRVAVTKLLTLRSVNGPNVTVIQGYPVPGATNGDSAVRCVYLTNGAALLGFSLTVGATRSSGDFLTEQSGGGVWCESASAFASNCLVMGNSANNYGGGVYGGTLRNCTVNSNSAHFGGGGAYGATMRDCLLNANRADYGGGAYAATLEHCIISGNSAGGDGGGANFCTLNNCKLSGNSAYEGGGASSGTLNYCTLSANLAETGGGAFVGTLNNCAIIGNSATNSGGGAAGGAMNNCTLVGNSATSRSGGADGSVMNNCILYYNVAPQGANYTIYAMGPEIYGILYYCCTTPLPTNGAANIASEPLFVDRLAGNLRLQSNSPCINAGSNAYSFGNTDLDGRPRIVGGRVDLGAYELQSAATGIFIAWLQQYGLPIDGSADFTDADGDGLNNWQEWRAGTDPTNALSVLRMLPPSRSGTDLIVSWQSVPTGRYSLDRSADLGVITHFEPVATNLAAQGVTMTYTHTNAGVGGPWFYRVSVQ